MRVLHILSSLCAGGAEVYIRDLSRQLVAQEHNVCIAYISSAASLERSIEFETAFIEQLEDSGISYFIIGHECRQRPLHGGMRLRKIVKNFNPDVIHSHLFYGLLFMEFAFLHLPLVYTHHNRGLGKNWYLFPWFKRRVDQIVGISRDCTVALKKAGVNNVTTIYNCVNGDRLIAKNKCDYRTNQTVFLAVGRLAKQKNYKLLINAIYILLKRRADLHERFILQIAGEGEQENELQMLISKLELNSHIILLGNRQDIPDLLHSSDIFVMSSDWEGLPIALLEALMTGLPVVVTDVGGCRDVVEACVAGTIVPSGNALALADAIERMVTDENYRRECGTNALEKSQIFSISRAADEHLSMYSKLIAAKSVVFRHDNNF